MSLTIEKEIKGSRQQKERGWKFWEEQEVAWLEPEIPN